MKAAFYCTIIISIFSVISCKKVDVNSDNGNRELLINKKWNIIAATVQTVGTNSQRDSYSMYPDYERDNYQLFRSDGTYENNANILKSPYNSNDILVSGTWELTQNDTFIKITPNNGITALSYTIVKLTANSLKTEAIGPNGELYRITFSPIP